MYAAVGENGNSIELTEHFYFRGVLLSIKNWCSDHGGRISTTELAEMVQSKKSKVKRHAREVLGEGLKAGQRQGYAKQLTLQQAIEVYLYGLLIRYLNQKEIRHTIGRVVSCLKEQGEILK